MPIESIERRREREGEKRQGTGVLAQWVVHSQHAIKSKDTHEQWCLPVLSCPTLGYAIQYCPIQYYPMLSFPTSSHL
jgi:hypothetical protein